MINKICSKCKKELPETSFYKRTGSNSRHSACIKCERLMAKDWYERNKEKAQKKVREWRLANTKRVKEYRIKNRQKNYRQELVRKYGVPFEWFDKQFKEQEGKCATCFNELIGTNKQNKPHVDHCHDTGKVRAILCNRCNSILGLSNDDSDLLSTLSGYIKCHGL